MSDSLYTKLQSYALEKKDDVALCQNEEQTKLTLINPYMELLGFGVRNPRQVRVEFETGIGKGVERVDYAILDDELPIVLIEAKSTKVDLGTGEPSPQLQRYAIDASSVRFAAMTNGIKWKWYYKDANQKLADRPFLVVDALQPREVDAAWLSKLGKSLSHNETLEAAKGEYLTTRFIEWFENAQHSPSDALLRLAHKEIDQKSRVSQSQLEVVRAHWIRACLEAKESWLQSRLEKARRSEQSIPPQTQQTQVSLVDTGEGSRSCRVRFPNGEFRILANGTELLLYIVEYCAGQHRGGEDAFLRSVAKPLPPIGVHKAVIAPDDQISLQKRRRLYSGTTFRGYRVFNNLDNFTKASFIQSLLSACILPSGGSPVLGTHLEIDLPNSDLQIRGT